MLFTISLYLVSVGIKQLLGKFIVHPGIFRPSLVSWSCEQPFYSHESPSGFWQWSWYLEKCTSCKARSLFHFVDFEVINIKTRNSYIPVHRHKCCVQYSVILVPWGYEVEGRTEMVWNLPNNFFLLSSRFDIQWLVLHFQQQCKISWQDLFQHILHLKSSVFWKKRNNTSL